MEVHYVRTLLEAEGIKATVVGEMLGAARGELPLTLETQPAVFVNPSDSDAALAIVQEYLASGKEMPGEDEAVMEASWKCKKCGEEIEPQFAVCWSCEAPKDSSESDEAT
jgi:hypothetical protein